MPKHSSLTALLLSVCATVATARPATIDTDRIAAREFGADAPWYRDRIPFFESADAQLDQVYYYRWRIVRAHQRDLGAEGYVTTEFLDDVGWQREPRATLNDATGFHLGELRWLRDRRFAADYLDGMLTGGDDRHFSDYIADAVWSRYLVDGDRAAALRHLSALRYLFGAWNDHFDPAMGLYWIEPLLDATEYTIASIDASGGRDGFTGGQAFRPSINSYMFAQARALSQLTALAGDAPAAAAYAARAQAIKARVQDSLWSPGLGHFIDRYQVTNEFVHKGEPIRGRELVGFVPWAFDLPDDRPAYAAAWRHALSPAELAGPFGLRTVEPGYPHYMQQYRYADASPECQWNGPVWPFQTTQVLQGMINLLDHYHQPVVSRADFWRLLRQYAALHDQGGRLDLEEDYDPATGKRIVGVPRSHHYFHSGFDDLVLTGVVGLRPRADDVLEVNPLLPDRSDRQALPWFRAERIPYHGHLIAVTWDVDGRHYGQGPGLRLEVDGRAIASRPTLGRLAVPLRRRAEPAVARPLDLAVQLVRGGFPRPSASSGNDAEALHAAVDGRVMFFPEAARGWSPAQDGGEEWFAVDLGTTRTVTGAELAFFVDGGHHAIPSSYRLQYRVRRLWHDLAASTRPAVANGVTAVSWPAVRAEGVRVVLRQPPGLRARLVELKLF